MESVLPEEAKEMIGYRVGHTRRKQFIGLSRQANYQKPAHFMKALIDRLVEVIGDEEFDVRNLVLQEPVLQDAIPSQQK
ncbi:MAG TPA: hypothetical protein VGB77_09355 [Abditibacteriaceae bacterium]|jgi:hypothetical protein